MLGGVFLVVFSFLSFLLPSAVGVAVFGRGRLLGGGACGRGVRRALGVAVVGGVSCVGAVGGVRAACGRVRGGCGCGGVSCRSVRAGAAAAGAVGLLVVVVGVCACVGGVGGVGCLRVRARGACGRGAVRSVPWRGAVLLGARVAACGWGCCLARGCGRFCRLRGCRGRSRARRRFA